MSPDRSMISRRAAVLGAAGLAAPAILARSVRAQAMPELVTLRSTAKSWIWAVEDYANGGGFFAKIGVKVTSNASNRGSNIGALKGGGVDIVLGDLGEPTRARAQNLPVKTILTTVNRYASHVVLKKEAMARAGVTEKSPPEKKFAALKGLKLGGTGPGAASDGLLRYFASLAGLHPDRDLQVVPVQGGGPGMLAALQQNVIDGFCLSSPTSDLAVQKQNCDYLFQMVLNPPPSMAEYQYIVASVAEDALRKRHEAILRYCKGVVLALRSIAAEPEKFRIWARAWFDGMDPDIFASAFANNSKIYVTDPTPRADLFARNLEFISTVNRTMAGEPLPASLTFETMFDPSLAQEAVRSL